jgi:hypothetical protein
VVHHDTLSGVRIEFEGIGHDTSILGSQDPEALKARIEQP